jgi:phage-related protein
MRRPGPPFIGPEAPAYSRAPGLLVGQLADYTQTDIMTLKPLRFLGDSLKRLREFPKDAKHDAGYQLDQVQRGRRPADFKPMPSVGKGVEEIRVWEESGTYRVIYTARLVDAVVVLHTFQKKTQATSKQDLAIAKERFAQLMRERR